MGGYTRLRKEPSTKSEVIVKKILKSLIKAGISLFLIFQLFLFCEALYEPKDDVIFYSGINSSTSMIEKEHLDVKFQDNNFDSNKESIDPYCMASGDYMGEEFCKRYKEWAGWE
jgi:hypothetical protein